jgi:hypothetical protein
VVARNRERPRIHRVLGRSFRAGQTRGRSGPADRVSYAFEVLAIPRLQLFIEPWNVASQRTAEYGGFTQEALLRGWERIGGAQHDAYCYALLHQDWNAPGRPSTTMRSTERHRHAGRLRRRAVIVVGRRPLCIAALADGRAEPSGPRCDAGDGRPAQDAEASGPHLRTTAGTAAVDHKEGPVAVVASVIGVIAVVVFIVGLGSLSVRRRTRDGHRLEARTRADLPEAGVVSSINGSEPVSDIDPTLWADPAATYDKVASAYAATFLHELDHKPFDREILTRFAAATRRGSHEGHPVCDLGCGPGHIGAFLAAMVSTRSGHRPLGRHGGASPPLVPEPVL